MCSLVAAFLQKQKHKPFSPASVSDLFPEVIQACDVLMSSEVELPLVDLTYTASHTTQVSKFESVQNIRKKAVQWLL